MPPHSTSPITRRSVLLGFAGVILICGLTPYNDYALNNTFLVGNNFPLGVVMLLFLFALLVNGPLSRFAPRHAFSAGELTVTFSMTLISCALPSSGLMRYFPPSLVRPFYTAQRLHEWLVLLESFHVPRWLFPKFQGNGPDQWMNDPVVIGYVRHWTGPGAAPYLAWLTPTFTWGIFFAALFGALICIVVIVRRQWFENERLAFPLAQIYLSLLETPEPGNLFNSIMRRRSFWLAFGAVFALHLWNGLARYDRKHFPEIWVYYHLNYIFSEPPWSYVHEKLMDAAIFFTVVGVTYFLPTSISFSMWFFFIVRQLQRMWLGTYTGDPEVYGQHDQHFGGCLAYLCAIAWIGRAHWKLVLRQSFGLATADEPKGRYIPYPLAFWTMIACIIVMIAWLIAAGANLLASSVSVILLLMLFLVITRFVAEAGLVHGQLQVPIYKTWQLLVRAGVHYPIPVQSYYVTSFLQCHHYDFREVVPVYASHGMKVADQTLFAPHSQSNDSAQERSIGRRFIVCLALSLIIGYFISFASTLWVEYKYEFSKDTQAKLVNDWGAADNPDSAVVGSTLQYNRQTFEQPHSSAAHIGFGFVFTSLLSFLRLRYTWWPLHPIGYLMLDTYPSDHLWLSFLLGWLIKVLILRFGGARGFSSSRPFFLGMIVGESAAAGFWLILGIVLSAMGFPYRPVNIMPG